MQLTDFSVPVLYDHLTKSTEWDNFVIQRRIRSHSDIVQLTGSEALQTARIITCVTPQGDIDVYLTFFRIVVGANFYDNYNYGLSGNLIANIDPVSGRLTTATGASPNGIGFSVLTNHPKTGAPFADFQLPHWQEARKLAEHAAMLFLPLRTIGWDLALTDDGPLLLQGNAEWDPVNHLVMHAGPEHQLELADSIVFALRRAWRVCQHHDAQSAGRARHPAQVHTVPHGLAGTLDETTTSLHPVNVDHLG